MPRYTDAQRRKGLATRRRNALQRRKEIERLGYNPYNPTVKLNNGVVVTSKVEKRLDAKASTETALSVSEILTIFVVWGLCLLVATGLSIDGERPAWRWLFLLPAFIVSIVVGTFHEKRVTLRKLQLAEERKIRLDEMRRFYTSPEWLIIRKQVIREEGSTCSRCKKHIPNKEDVTVDHKLPRSKYPDLALDRKNLCVLCRSCNSKKGDSDSEIFVAEIE